MPTIFPKDVNNLLTTILGKELTKIYSNHTPPMCVAVGVSMLWFAQEIWKVQGLVTLLLSLNKRTDYGNITRMQASCKRTINNLIEVRVALHTVSSKF